MQQSADHEQRYGVEHLGGVWVAVDYSKDPPSIEYNTEDRHLAYSRAKELNETVEHPPTPIVSEAVSAETGAEGSRDRLIYQIVTGSSTISAKIRQLYRLNLTSGDIAKRLGVRYQQVHNVIAKGVPAVDPSAVCKVCGRPLTDEASIAMGMGPKCQGHSRKQEEDSS